MATASKPFPIPTAFDRIQSPSFPRSRAVRCNSQPSRTLRTTSKTLPSDPSPLFRSVKAFAPATVANFGPGHDVCGCAVEGLGDTVTVSVDPAVEPGTLSISSISGPAAVSKLSRDPLLNCAGIAGNAIMEMLGIRSVGLSLSLEKGLPLGSGLGSSAASAAAAAFAINELFGGPLSVYDLVLAGLESEKVVSGYHADNIAPSIMGGFISIRYHPLELTRLEFPADRDLFFVLVSPELEAPTSKMREVLLSEVKKEDREYNSRQLDALFAAVLRGDVRAFGLAMSSDVIVEPKRAPLIPGMLGVKKAALKAGAFGCTISGAGPTLVAVIDSEEMGKEIGDRMVETFLLEGNLKAVATVTKLDRVGARVISGDPITTRLLMPSSR